MQSLKSSYYNLGLQIIERLKYIEIALTGNYSDKVIKIYNELLTYKYISNKKLNKIINVNNKYREALLDYFGLYQLSATKDWVTDKNIYSLLFE